MDWNLVILTVTIVGFVLVVSVMCWSAAMRMSGRRSRFDRLTETIFRAQGAGVYPPSLRGESQSAVVEEIEDSRAARSAGETAADKPRNSRTE